MPTTAVTGTDQVLTDTAAFERKAYFALRRELYFYRCATVKPTMETHPGSSVVFDILTELAAAITPLIELSDVTPVALSDTTTSVTLVEQGNATTVSSKLRGTSYLNEMMRVSREIGYNAGLSHDTLARNPLLLGSQVFFGGNATSRVTLDAADVLSAANVRQARAVLAGGAVRRFGETYKAFIDPDVVYDLTTEVGADSWRDPHVHSKPEEIWIGSVGRFEGFDFIETPRLGPPELPAGWVNGGAGALVDAYPTLFLGEEALAMAHAKPICGPQPMIEVAPVTDILNRFRGLGWYWLGGFARFREASLVRYETASSIGANT